MRLAIKFYYQRVTACSAIHYFVSYFDLLNMLICTGTPIKYIAFAQC